MKARSVADQADEDKIGEEGLQEYAIKSRGFRFKNSRWPCRDLGDAIQGQTHGASK